MFFILWRTSGFNALNRMLEILGWADGHTKIIRIDCTCTTRNSLTAACTCNVQKQLQLQATLAALQILWGQHLCQVRWDATVSCNHHL